MSFFLGNGKETRTQCLRPHSSAGRGGAQEFAVWTADACRNSLRPHTDSKLYCLVTGTAGMRERLAPTWLMSHR